MHKLSESINPPSIWYIVLIQIFLSGGKGKLCRQRQGVSEDLKVEFSSSRSTKYKKCRWNLCKSMQLKGLKFENYFKIFHSMNFPRSMHSV